MDRNLEAEKAQQRNDSIFNEISKNWIFTFPKTNPEIEKTLTEWNSWHQFQNELEQKPKTTISAFQTKIETVSKQTDSLQFTVPERFNTPQVRSRLITLNTQLNSLNTYIQLQEIPKEKVIALIKIVNLEIASVYDQLEEVVIKERIPMEIGEEDMIRALDTTRLANEKLFEENLIKTDSILDENPTPKREPLINQLSRE